MDNKYANVPLCETCTDLFLASQRNHPKCLEKLLLEEEQLKNINLRTLHDGTALCVAANKGHIECVNVLINIGKADVNICDWAGNTPLHLCAYWADQSFIVKGTPNYPIVNKDNGYELCVLKLLESDANPYAENYHISKRTSIDIAQNDKIKKLIEKHHLKDNCGVDVYPYISLKPYTKKEDPIIPCDFY